MAKRLQYKYKQKIGDKGIKYLRDSKQKGSHRRASFLCPCGIIFESRIHHIKTNSIPSCGCSNPLKLKYIEGQLLGDFGLIYIKDITLPSKPRKAKFQCSCGKIFDTSIASVKHNSTKSCGCLQSQSIIKRQTKHGDSIRSSFLNYLYQAWAGIKSRCLNTNEISYPDYGGRGISIYPEWLEYIPFKKWILDNIGERPEDYSIDRIDNGGNYEPGNVRWANSKTQNNNKRPRRWKK